MMIRLGLLVICTAGLLISATKPATDLTWAVVGLTMFAAMVALLGSVLWPPLRRRLADRAATTELSVPLVRPVPRYRAGV